MQSEIILHPSNLHLKEWCNIYGKYAIAIKNVSQAFHKVTRLNRYPRAMCPVPTFLFQPRWFRSRVRKVIAGPFWRLDYGRNWPWIEPKKHCSTERSRNPAARGLTCWSPIFSRSPVIPRKELIDLIRRLCINKYLLPRLYTSESSTESNAASPKILCTMKE